MFCFACLNNNRETKVKYYSPLLCILFSKIRRNLVLLFIHLNCLSLHLFLVQNQLLMRIITIGINSTRGKSLSVAQYVYLSQINKETPRMTQISRSKALAMHASHLKEVRYEGSIKSLKTQFLSPLTIIKKICNEQKFLSNSLIFFQDNFKFCARFECLGAFGS